MSLSPSLWQQVLAKSRHLFASTLLSRFTGLLRDLVTAATFGASPTLGAFMVAFRLSNLFRRVLGEGALNNAFIPLYKKLQHQKAEGALDFYKTLRSFLLFLLLAIACIGQGILAALYFLGGYRGEVITFTAIMLPSMVMISFYSLSAAYLNSQKKFFLAGIAPAVFNILWIAFCFIGAWGNYGLWVLAFGVLIAYLAEWTICDPTFFRYFVFKGFQTKLKEFSQEFSHLIKYFSLTALGVGASQFNSALDAIFARYAMLEGPCYLWYALRIQQLPLALIALALSTVSFSYISEPSSNDEELHSFISESLKQKTAWLLPLTFVMFSTAFSGMNLVYGHGAFSAYDVSQSTYCFMAYTLGLWPMSLSLQLANLYYRHHLYKLPSFFAFISVLFNIALNAFFVFGMSWGPLSVALSTSLSSFLNAALLYKKVPPSLKKPDLPVKFIFKYLVIGFLSFLLATFIKGFHQFPLTRMFSLQITYFLIDSGVVLGALALFGYLFKAQYLIPRLR